MFLPCEWPGSHLFGLASFVCSEQIRQRVLVPALVEGTFLVIRPVQYCRMDGFADIANTTTGSHVPPDESDALFDSPVDQLSEIALQALEETSALVQYVLAFHSNAKSRTSSDRGPPSVNGPAHTALAVGAQAEQHQSLPRMTIQNMINTYPGLAKEIQLRVEELHLASTLSSTNAETPGHLRNGPFQWIADMYG